MALATKDPDFPLFQVQYHFLFEKSVSVRENGMANGKSTWKGSLTIIYGSVCVSAYKVRQEGSWDGIATVTVEQVYSEKEYMTLYRNQPI